MMMMRSRTPNLSWIGRHHGWHYYVLLLRFCFEQFYSVIVAFIVISGLVGATPSINILLCRLGVLWQHPSPLLEPPLGS